MTEKRTCIICESKPGGSWLYQWKGKQGGACSDCGQMFHNIGDYLNDRAAELMKEQGIDIMQTKEKFGGFRIYVGSVDERQQKFMQALHRQYKIMFPDFSWEWDFCDE